MPTKQRKKRPAEYALHKGRRVYISHFGWDVDGMTEVSPVGEPWVIRVPTAELEIIPPRVKAKPSKPAVDDGPCMNCEVHPATETARDNSGTWGSVCRACARKPRHELDFY